ncbi:MAG: hypothetical protein AAB354_15230 [candidate division KSB1 bacterium]
MFGNGEIDAEKLDMRQVNFAHEGNRQRIAIADMVDDNSANIFFAPFGAVAGFMLGLVEKPQKCGR